MIEWHVARYHDGTELVYETQVWKLQATGRWERLSDAERNAVNPNDESINQRVVEWSGPVPKPPRDGYPPRASW